MMNPSEIALLSLGVSAISVLVAILALVRSRGLRQVQEKLANLELIRLTQKANVLVMFTAQHTIRYRERFQRTGTVPDYVPVPESKNTYYLVIKNIGNVEARNIRLEFAPISEKQETPHFLQEIKPIPLLAAGLDVTFPIILTLGDTHELIGTWDWQNPDGTTEKRQSYLVIPIPE